MRAKWISHTLDSGINIGVHLLIFGLFSRGYVFTREGNAYFISKYPQFDGIGDAYFKGFGVTFIPGLRLFQSLEYIR